MPLPKPPSKKGDLLKSADYEAQAAPRADKRSARTRAAEAPAQTALDLHDGSEAPPAVAPPRLRGAVVAVAPALSLIHI